MNNNNNEVKKKNKSHKYMHILCVVAVVGMIAVMLLRGFGVISPSIGIFGSSLFFVVCMISHVLMIPLMMKFMHKE